MKSFKNVILESLYTKKINISQLFLLQKDFIDIKTFAINNDVTEKHSKEIKDVLKTGNIVILSHQDVKDDFKQDDQDTVFKDINKLIRYGIRYGNVLGLSDEEKKQRKEAEINAGEEPKDNDDVKFVEDCIDKYIKVDYNNISKFFWKKDGSDLYLIVVLEDSQDIDNLIKEL